MKTLYIFNDFAENIELKLVVKSQNSISAPFLYFELRVVSHVTFCAESIALYGVTVSPMVAVIDISTLKCI